MPGRMSPLQRGVVAALVSVLALASWVAPSSAFRIGGPLDRVPGNPAERLAALAVEEPEYDHATRCLRVRRPGVARMVAWLDRHAAGTSWGTYRCERWGADQASLHAEGRAIDWHLDSRVPGQRAAGARLIRLLLAPDSTGTPHALARRMGLQEIIWDCSYWGTGMEEFSRYRPCFSRDGRRRKRRVNPTIAHQDHLHLGMTKAGAMGRTSFWTGRADR